MKKSPPMASAVSLLCAGAGAGAGADMLVVAVVSVCIWRSDQ